MRFLSLTALAACLGALPAAAPGAEGPFLAKPYLQLGHAPAEGTLSLLWHAPDADTDGQADWSVAYRPRADAPWRTAEAPRARRVAVEGVAPHRVYRARLTGLAPGSSFPYEVRVGGRAVFSAEGRAPGGRDQPYRFVAFGDGGAGTPEQKAIAYRAFLARPDFVMIPGDIVYARGRASEYREKFWPVYNADRAGPGTGAPLLRSIPFLAAPGNHDVATRDLDKYPDGLAYFYYWDQPLNGPAGAEGSATVPPLVASGAHRGAFAAAAGPAYPGMANFSFDHGNAHWTVLDANPYVNWDDRNLRDWVARDLAAARGATWRFVAFHHPGFNSSKAHYEQQQMRRLAGLLEEGKADLVFSGHVHNYQRSFPLKFVAGAGGDDRPVLDKAGKPITGAALVGGHWTLDRAFDGQTRTRPDGVIYLVTGAGGQGLYNPEQTDEPDTWQGFTAKFYSRTHSLTVADVRGATLTVRQITADGTEVDRFVVTK